MYQALYPTSPLAALGADMWYSPKYVDDIKVFARYGYVIRVTSTIHFVRNTNLS
jgi:hypothetical protein